MFAIDSVRATGEGKPPNFPGKRGGKRKNTVIVPGWLKVLAAPKFRSQRRSDLFGFEFETGEAREGGTRLCLVPK